MNDLRASFADRFGQLHGVYRAPGRVNLIGEHTDYNGGFVMPAALDFSCWVAAGVRADSRIAFFSENTGESFEVALDLAGMKPSGKWHDYPVGVAWALLDAGFALRGASLYIRGEVPLGAGLSSSAAIEVAAAVALLDVAGLTAEPTRLALLSQKAENDFVGARCGIMDQFVACHGRAGNAVRLDCRSLEHEFVPLPADIALVICNSMVRHGLATGEYNVRRAQCEEGVRLVASARPGVTSLRDLTMADLDKAQSQLPEVIYRRCRHVLSENARVLRVAAALREGRAAEVGEAMFASHASLRDDYEVSCVELDLLVDLARKERGIIGARMTGGGFGGCTVNLVEAEAAPTFRQNVARQYEARTGTHPEIYLSRTADGAERVL